MKAQRIIDTLGLEHARILAKASATEDYARGLTDRAESYPETRELSDATQIWWTRVASAHVIAGSLWMLVSARDASGPLGHAGAIHARIRSPYGSLLSMCAHPRHPAPAPQIQSSAAERIRTERPDDFERSSASERAPALVDLQPAASLLAHLWPIAAGISDQSLRKSLSDTPILEALPGSWLTGRLRIPLAHYRGLAGDVDRLRNREHTHKSPGKRPFTAAGAFLDRATEAISAARSNEHQWRTLRSPILPVEPEVVAACVLVEMTARDTLGLSARKVINMPTRSLGGAVMGVAENLLDADAEAVPKR
jgi:hypothetical protein